jgi:CDP-2,3-bis-(O-geranylgeranyl)-sn-glycerol synthase
MAELLGPLDTLLALLPALAANGSPVLLRGRGRPLDGGRVFRDGRPLLGRGKTYEGTIIGILFGSTLAYFLAALAGSPVVFAAGSLAAAGAILGDIAAAFAKRRLGLERGAPAPLLDQLDFYSGAVIAATLAGYLLTPLVVLTLAPLVPLLHRATNYAAYRLGLKNVPW